MIKQKHGRTLIHLYILLLTLLSGLRKKDSSKCNHNEEDDEYKWNNCIVNIV